MLCKFLKVSPKFECWLLFKFDKTGETLIIDCFSSPIIVFTELENPLVCPTQQWVKVLQESVKERAYTCTRPWRV